MALVRRVRLERRGRGGGHEHRVVLAVEVELHGIGVRLDDEVHRRRVDARLLQNEREIAVAELGESLRADDDGLAAQVGEGGDALWCPDLDAAGVNAAKRDDLRSGLHGVRDRRREEDRHVELARRQRGRAAGVRDLDVGETFVAQVALGGHDRRVARCALDAEGGRLRRR